VHALVIPKGPYVSADDFNADAPADAVAGFWRAVAHVARILGVDKTGYRLIANHGAHGAPEIPHFHIHILGGRPLGPMLARPRD
jgi:diadenosine tetraphosphate (Ap4A) HIT family hydrolase